MMSNKKMGKLGKMKMPGDSKLDLSDLDMGQSADDQDSSDDSGSDSDEGSLEAEGDVEGKMEPSSNPALEKVSDDELMAEIKKRGLVSDLEGHDQQEPQPSQHLDDEDMPS